MATFTADSVMPCFSAASRVDSRAARDIEQSVQAKEAVQNLDEWPRKVWIARKYGYSFPEIASFLGMSEAQVKLRFRYALARLREKLGL